MPNSLSYRMLRSRSISSRSFTTKSNGGLNSGSRFQHFSISSQQLCENTSNLSGVLLSAVFIMSITSGRRWQFIFCGSLPCPSHTLHSNMPNAYTSTVLSRCCTIISSAMFIGVPTSELLTRCSGFHRPRSVSLALLSSSNCKDKGDRLKSCPIMLTMCIC